MNPDFQSDVEIVSQIPAVPAILEMVCRSTGMRFAAVARVTEDRWVTCSVLDRIDFGLKPGDELKVSTTICNEIRQHGEIVAIENAAHEEAWRGHPTPVMYGFQSYVSVPITLEDGSFFGTLCAIDPLPARTRAPEVIGTFRLFAELIARSLDAKKKLEVTEAALQLAHSVIESNTDCVQVLDGEGKILSMNQNGCRLMEVDDALPILGRSWLDLWEGIENQKASEAFQTARNGNTARFSGYSKFAKGQAKRWEVTLSLIVNPMGRPGHILCISRDISNRSIEEAQLRETAKLESLGVLAGGIAHDFNNLLTGVLGNASILQESATPEEAPIVDQIVDAAQRAADLTRQMLAYSGKGRFVLKPLNLSVVITEILGLIRSMIDKKVEVILSMDEHLPPINADPGQMQQLFMNLLINGSEAMEGKEGKVFVSTAVVDIDASFVAQTFRFDEPSPAAGRYVRVTVQDTGCGMGEETISRIFEPFYTTKFTGRGLGLAAASGIIRGHRGAVRVSSQVGNGTTFTVFFPVAASALTVAPAANPSSTLHGWGTILVVDDEEGVRRVAKLVLERCGFQVLLAENGKAAVSLFGEQRENIRLIVLDLTMPVMGGEETLSLLRDIDPEIPIVLSSGYNETEFIQRFTGSPTRGFIQKPYTAKQIEEAVAKALPGD